MVLCAIGNEESADTDSGEKVSSNSSFLHWMLFQVATAVTRIGNFLEMCGYWNSETPPSGKLCLYVDLKINSNKNDHFSIS